MTQSTRNFEEKEEVERSSKGEELRVCVAEKKEGYNLSYFLMLRTDDWDVTILFWDTIMSSLQKCCLGSIL